MLSVFRSLKELNFGKLMDVYYEGNCKNAEEEYPNDEKNVGVLKAEQDFYQYLNEVFFPVGGAFYAVWEENGCYLSALRLEPYQDGLLLEALETHPDFRRKGYAKRLILSVLELIGKNCRTTIYSHVHKGNEASLRAHLSCGFQRISEQAIYIEGSLNTMSCTLQYRF